MRESSRTAADTPRWLSAKSTVWWGLAVHTAIFIAVAVGVFLLGEDWNLFWPLIGWTGGLLMHGISALVSTRIISGHLERPQDYSGS
jgi:hypothetical protein